MQELQEKYPEDLEKALTDPWYNIYIYHPEDEIGFNRIFFSLENDIITKAIAPCSLTFLRCIT